jgi:hypothetical protein
MRLSGLICGAVLCLAAGMAHAEDPFAGDWHFDFTGYLWAPSLNGSLTVKGREAPINLSFINILQDTDSLIGLEGRIGVRKGRFGVYVDGLYNKLGANDLSGPHGFAKSDASVNLTFIESAIYYDLFDLPRQKSPDGQDTWSWGIETDVYAGARYTNLGASLKLKSIGQINVNQTRSANENWVDPIIGGRVTLQLSDNWRAYVDNNIGGFGAGSKLAYSGIALVGYQFPLFGLDSTAWAGYKALYQDFQNGSGKDEFRWNMWLHGPIAGLTIRFF